jgi:ABC-type transport system involved in multi-copper enzyme maturation permease subunit
MAKYISAELYKVAHRKYPYGFLAVILGGIALVFLMIRWEDRLETVWVVGFSDMVSGLTILLTTGLYLVLCTCDMVFSEQYKHNTLKNEVSFGLPRSRIYLGKLFTAMLLSVVLCAVIIAFYLGLAAVIFPKSEEMWAAWGYASWQEAVDRGIYSVSASLLRLAKVLLMAFPLWLGGLCFVYMLQVALKSSTVAVVVYVVVLLQGSGFLELFRVILPKLQPLYRMLMVCHLMTPFNQLFSDKPSDLSQLTLYAWVLGLSWAVVSTAVGLWVFRKREIS